MGISVVAQQFIVEEINDEWSVFCLFSDAIKKIYFIQIRPDKHRIYTYIYSIGHLFHGEHEQVIIPRGLTFERITFCFVDIAAYCRVEFSSVKGVNYRHVLQ